MTATSSSCMRSILSAVGDAESAGARDTGPAMSYENSEGAMEPTVHRPGEGERIGGPTMVTIKATGAETNDSFYLGEAVVEPGFPGPPPHVHDRLYDMFYVLDGALTMRLGDETTELPSGSFVCVPPGVVHTFSNQS